MRRRGDDLATPGGMPPELRTFDPVAWSPRVEAPPEGWAFGVARWEQIRSAELWREAGRSWLDDRGRRGEWFVLTRTRAVVW